MHLQRKIMPYLLLHHDMMRMPCVSAWEHRCHGRLRRSDDAMRDALPASGGHVCAYCPHSGMFRPACYTRCWEEAQSRDHGGDHVAVACMATLKAVRFFQSSCFVPGTPALSRQIRDACHPAQRKYSPSQESVTGIRRFASVAFYSTAFFARQSALPTLKQRDGFHRWFRRHKDD